MAVPCPCCGYLTKDEPWDFEICPVCFWQDDGQNDTNADESWGGANGSLSLAAARESFRRIGASSTRDLRYVRQPRPHEIPESS